MMVIAVGVGAIALFLLLVFVFGGLVSWVFGIKDLSHLSPGEENSAFDTFLQKSLVGALTLLALTGVWVLFYGTGWFFILGP